MIHGTPNSYKNGGCRCDPCRKAASRAHKEWRLRTQVGSGRGNQRPTRPTMVDSTVTREHFDKLIASGWSQRTIAEALGYKSRGKFSAIHKSKRVYRKTEAEILSLSPLEPVAVDEVTVNRLAESGVHWKDIPCTKEERLAAFAIVKERAKGRAAYRLAGWGEQDIQIEGVASARRRLGLR